MKTELKAQIDGNKIYSHLRKEWFVLTPEEKIRQNYVCKLINLYGYSLEQMAEELKVNNSQRGQGKARADLVIWKSKEDRIKGKSAFIVVECKAEHVKIQQEDYFQGANYAAWAGASFFVTTNEKETKFFSVDKEKLPKKLNEVVVLPNEQQAQSEKEIKKLGSQTKTFSREEFANLLFKCHCIIRNNDKLSPEGAFDEISKILFMKIRYERNPDAETIFSLDKFKKLEANYEKNERPVNIKRFGEKANIPYMQNWFELTKEEFKDDRLFDENDKINIKQHSFEQIVKELEKYNLSDTSDDVKGIAFEKFLGNTFRGDLGQFFTPRTLVDYMVEILDPEEGETICDPTCGSGGFLIKAFEYVREKIENDIDEYKKQVKEQYFTEEFTKLSEKEQEQITEKVNNILSKLNKDLEIPNKRAKDQTDEEKQRRITRLSSSCIYGTDANPRMARTSKMNMIMHGDGHGGVHHHDGLININGIFEERFDVILTNPPFGARVDKSQVLSAQDKFTDNTKIEEYEKLYGNAYTKQLKELNKAIDEKKKILSFFDLGKDQNGALTEVLFMERCLKLLKKGGRMAIVLPEGILNGSGLQKIRDYFEARAKILLITSIPSDVFSAAGATIKPSLLFFKRFTEREEKEYQKVVLKVKAEIDEKYKVQILEMNKQLKNDEKELLKELKLIEKQKEIDFETLGKERIKELFDYEIPIVHIEKAGITTTGGQCENELIPVAKEFRLYRELNSLWQSQGLKVKYKIEKEKLIRVVGEEEQVIND